MGPKKDPRLKQEIKVLTRAGKSQKEIAKVLQIHRNSVYRYQRSLGLGARRVLSNEKEQQILKLLPTTGTSKIGRLLGVGEHQARRVAAKYHFCRRPGEPGYRYRLSPAKHKKIVEDILYRRDHALPLARKYEVGYKTMLKLVKETLGCERLVSGRPKQALESDFPQNWPEMFAAARTGEGAADLFVKLVDSVLRKSFDGNFPFPQEYDAYFARALLYCFEQLVPEFETQPQPVLDNFLGGLSEAIATLRESRAAQWAN